MPARFSQRQLDRLAPSNLDILEALACFRFLTTSQIIALGIGSQRNAVYRMLKRFESFPKPLIGRSSFSEINSDKPGRTYKEQLLTLTPHGAELLMHLDPDGADRRHLARHRAVADRDYAHTKETVDFHILADQFAAMFGCEIDCFHTYHDLGSAELESPGLHLPRRLPRFEFALTDAQMRPVATHRFTADAVFHVTDPTGKGHLFAVEVQRGMDTKRLHTKLREHYIPALGEGAISTAYGVRYDPKVLVLCEQPSLMEHTLTRLADDPAFQGFERCFAFHTVEGLHGTPAALPQPEKILRITRETRMQIAAMLAGRPDWQAMMEANPLYRAHPRRFAKGWRGLRGDLRSIF